MSTARCFHCDEIIPSGSHFSLTFDEQQRCFCCAGCHAVADTIIQSGLADYYRFRTEPASRTEQLPAAIAAELKSFDAPDVLSDISTQQDDLTVIELSISGISCAACAWLIEKQLKQLPAVASASVNSTTQRCHLSWRSNITPLSDILSALAKIGYQASPFVADQEEQQFKNEL
ncbi:MAG: heavy metal translocating P-type ATPase metal-binding domain-containing protein, partial [Gammaproteobacteria bacterium]|nr:heavy metal translocating P-type ATPase metal-binding domain-containing protein [Gammaproteobacteria bacterium]